MEKIIIWALLSIAITGCGPSADELERTRRRAEMREEIRIENAVDNIESSMIQDAKKCWGYRPSSFEDYDIEKGASGFFLYAYWTSEKYNELGEFIMGGNESYTVTYKIKYDRNGKFKRCLSKTKE
uniref:Uncharacterized protein n=1 Tax=Candidatus Kentrum sp. TC TaxID=2126339 RepID=A0A450Z5Y0_9GAMM|nr:MAG: hypothetical protein BECKTC1821E_GA0114239_11652 [Candidatus Kentron sp. TC]